MSIFPPVTLDLGRPRAVALGILAVLAAGATVSCQPRSEPTPAERWRCRNDVEVQCLDGGCEVVTGDGFTPMSVDVDEAGQIGVCAYSGCWEGVGEARLDARFLVVVAHDLEFTTAPDNRLGAEDVVLAIDRDDGVGVLKAGAFAQPLLCERGASAG